MKFILEKIKYIHHNPINKKWQLVTDFTDYEHSSASLYEKGSAGINFVHCNPNLARPPGGQKI